MSDNIEDQPEGTIPMADQLPDDPAIEALVKIGRKVEAEALKLNIDWITDKFNGRLMIMGAQQALRSIETAISFAICDQMRRVGLENNDKAIETWLGPYFKASCVDVKAESNDNAGS